ncbi:hypothetical protein Y032_0015g2766 [Ancylostoma ceylanicum]|uniref:Uncharacterized protein n=1 Tax=Ancylostoma ceylanicum TaxID=53326 RepID=A0A016V8Q9_9BILA|nr:hypothetical protein Y032_0015g2766 [Ancylostoma ceylanicum]
MCAHAVAAVKSRNFQGIRIAYWICEIFTQLLWEWTIFLKIYTKRCRKPSWTTRWRSWGTSYAYTSLHFARSTLKPCAGCGCSVYFLSFRQILSKILTLSF